jgi:hypothetical protein
MPDIPGDYNVYAVFEGTNGHWPSNDTTSFTVAEAAITASPYPETILPPTEMYFAILGTAIKTTMVLCFAITILVLRKRS